MRPLDIVRTPNGDIAIVVEVTERGDSSIEYLPHQERRDWKSAWWGASDLTVLGNIAETLTNAMAHPFGKNTDQGSRFYADPPK